jgi:hypothetical protein
MYHSRIALCVGGSVWSVVRNIRCTVTIDSFLANSKTQKVFLFPVHAIFRHDCPLGVKPASTLRRLVKKKKKERFSTYLYAPLRRDHTGYCTADVGNPGGTYELPCVYIYIYDSVGIATDYGLDGPGIESRWGANFPRLSRPALGPTHPPVQRAPGLSRG